MISRIRLILIFFASSVWALAGVLMVGMLTLGAEDCVAQSPEDLDLCLNQLESSEQPYASGGLRLGRIIQNEEITGPVLIRKNATGYSFRRCSGNRPTEVEVTGYFELFNSALVARFRQQETVTLKKYRKAANSSDYEEDGEVALSLRGTGSMLEAQRQGGDHVTVVHFPPKRVTVLLITTRTAMKAMEPGRWEKSWGDQPEDLRIKREIIWWELASPTGLRAYPAVGSFVELKGILGGEESVGAEIEWSDILGVEKSQIRRVEDLKIILAREDVFSLFVVEEPEHIGLAEAMLTQAIKMNSDAELDVASREDRWRKMEVRERLEKAADWGQYLPLVRFQDLAIIMPDRIAGKIRRKYYQSKQWTDSRGVPVTLRDADSRTFQVANAIFLDQAAGMVRTMNFLGCLLENDAEAPSRREVLEKGLERMNIPTERLEELEEMDVSQAFQYLFQGFSLPSGLRAGDRSFPEGISSRDPEVLSLVRSLRRYLATTSFENDPSCEVALFPDSFLIGPPFPDPLVAVPSLPAPKIPGIEPDPNDVEAQDTEGKIRCEEARRAENEARDALKEAIYAKAARHTRTKIENGYEPFEKGIEILRKSNCKNTKKAIRLFDKAKRIFIKAKETADRIEHEKPKVRVH